MIAEITDKSNQASVFSLFSVSLPQFHVIMQNFILKSSSQISYRIGQTIGQPIGGLLAHPERNFSLFQSQFWYDYPFSLPCFVAASFAAVSVVLAYFNMKEVRHNVP